MNNYYIGIDLAWTYKNETGICVMNHNGEIIEAYAKVLSDAEIVALIQKYKGNVHVGIDAPIVVPNDNGSRSAERELMRSRVTGNRLYAFHCNRQFLLKNYGVLRGEVLVNELKAINPQFSLGVSDTHSIIETFPTGIVAGLFGEAFPIHYKRKRKMTIDDTINEMHRLVRHLSTLGVNVEIPEVKNRKTLKTTEDMLDAVLIATAFYVGIQRNNYEFFTFGTIEEGFITFSVKLKENPL